MGSATENWKSLYEAALLEPDSSRLHGRIVRARQAILDAIEELHTSGDTAERQALADALRMLTSLRRFADGAAAENVAARKCA